MFRDLKASAAKPIAVARSACHPSPGLPASFCGPRSADPDLFHCAKLVEQGSGVSEITGVESFSKPGEDVVQQLAGVTFRETPVHELDATAVEIVGAEEGPLIYRARAPESGQPMIVIAFDVQQSNLPKRIAFPVLIANIVGELSPNPLPATVPLGDPGPPLAVGDMTHPAHFGRFHSPS